MLNLDDPATTLKASIDTGSAMSKYNTGKLSTSIYTAQAGVWAGFRILTLKGRRCGVLTAIKDSTGLS